MKYDVIIYDWNGTLINDVKACLDILCQMLKKYGLKDIDLDSYKKAFTFPVRKYYEKVGFDFKNYTFEEVASHFVPLYDKYYPQCSLYEGAVDMIKKIKSMGVKQYLLSATEINSLLEQTNYFGVTDLFDRIVGTDNFYGKSKTEEAEHLFKIENLSKKRILLIGDTEYDYEVAKSIGADVILCDFGHKDREELLAVTNKVFSSYIEISDYLLI